MPKASTMVKLTSVIDIYYGGFLGDSLQKEHHTYF